MPPGHRAFVVKTIRSLHDPEDVQLAALRDQTQTRGFRHGRCADGAELVIQVKASSHGQANPTSNAGIDTDILLAIELPGSWVADDA